MFDHALSVSNHSSNLNAIKQVLCDGDVDLQTSELNAIIQAINGIKKANLINDTRALSEGDVFCAVMGTLLDGREFIEQALNLGAMMVFSETKSENEHGKLTWLAGPHGKNIPVVHYFELNENLFDVAKSFYLSPQQKLNIIGVTGTNGKTSTSQIIANLLDYCQKNCAIIGTNGAGKLNALQPINNTTPGATELHQLLSKFVEQQCTDVAMEVSSHALSQKRVSASLFSTAVFTNLTRDHLDYHQTMQNYALAKKKIFSGEKSQLAIINGDDCCGQDWLTHWNTSQPVIVYGTNESIVQHSMFVLAKNICCHSTGIDFSLHTHVGACEISSRLLGRFNIENLLAAISVLLANNVALNTIVDATKQLTPIMGRMESFTGNGKPTVVVDYAHTPDALESALNACREHCAGDLWVVFGCGGDRDQGKRALMAEVAERCADKLIITNDNPRSEEPAEIARHIQLGLSPAADVSTILNRECAVKNTFENAKTGDVILCAGKGHEDYIIIGKEKHHYNERAVVKALYQVEAKL